MPRYSGCSSAKVWMMTLARASESDIDEDGGRGSAKIASLRTVRQHLAQRLCVRGGLRHRFDSFQLTARALILAQRAVRLRTNDRESHALVRRRHFPAHRIRLVERPL